MKTIMAGLMALLPLLAGGCSSLGGTTHVAAATPAQPGHAAPGSQDETTLYLNVIDQLESQQHDDAALAFLDAFALKQSDPPPRYWLLRGNALLASQRGPEARAAYERLKDTPFAADGFNGGGQVAAAGGQWASAEQNFQQAVQARPTDAQFINNLAFSEMHLGKTAAAVSHLHQAHDLDPSSGLIRNNLIIALANAGDRPGADKVIAEIKSEEERKQLRQFLDGPGKTLAGGTLS